MAKFKVGDRVIIKDLPVDDYDGLTYNSSMKTLAGEVDIITRIDPFGHYNLERLGWAWNNNMIELAPEEYQNKRFHYRVGDPVMFRGEKTIVVSVHANNYYYYTRDYSEWVRFEELTPLDGFDYEKYEVPAYNVGDIVVCKVKHGNTYYGGLPIARDMLEYKGEIGVITCVRTNCNSKEEGARYDCTFDNGNWTWNSLLLEKVESNRLFKPNEIAVQLSNPPRLCTFDGEKFEGADNESPQAFVHATEQKVKLRKDAFGIGEEGEIIKSYVAEFTNQVLAAETKNKVISHTLYEGEYMEV